MTEIVSFDARRVEKYVDTAIEQFFGDPPDSEYQRGFLSALVTIKREALCKSNALLDAADRMTESAP